jgi:hypothetical protein
MALSQAAVLSKIRLLTEGVTGLARCYGQAETDGNRIPVVLPECPAAIIMAGQTLEYVLQPGGQRHTYEVRVLLFDDGSDIGERGASASVFADSLIAMFEDNVTLGGIANPCVFKRCDGFGTLEWGERTYLGTEIILEVSEQATASPAAGS